MHNQFRQAQPSVVHHVGFKPGPYGHVMAKPPSSATAEVVTKFVSRSLWQGQPPVACQSLNLRSKAWLEANCCWHTTLHTQVCCSTCSHCPGRWSSAQA